MFRSRSGLVGASVLVQVSWSGYSMRFILYP